MFLLLRPATFSHYKQNTIGRRIERRMAVHQLVQMDEYARYLQQTPAEVDALFHDLLIGVTSFFRRRLTLCASRSFRGFLRKDRLVP